MSIETLFANRIEDIQPSAIRTIFALLKRPGIISFAGGWPDPALFPVDELRDVVDHVLATDSANALQYGATNGDERLLGFLRARLQRVYGMAINGDEIMITSGSQQGIYLTDALLLNKGDAIVVEAPTFVGAFGGMQTFEADILEVAMDAHGLDTEALEQILQERKVKVVYTIPEFQNPSGRTMSLARRRRLVALAQQYDFVILEDAPYSDLRYEGVPMPPIYTLDTNGRTFYLGSFSKTLAPQRVGWVVAPSKVIRKMSFLKMAMDVCTPTLTQAIFAEFCERGLLETHIETLKVAYGKKRNTMLSALDRFMPAEVEWTNPQGGMFIWMTLPKGMDAEKVFHAALEENVAFVIGSAFYANSENAPKNTLRLNFVTPSEEQITTGLQILGTVIAAYEG
jgi:2-aminoadipate transaminase